MKVEVLQENLAKGVITASRFASTRAQLPILGNILLRAGKTKLSIISTNLEISCSVSIGAKVSKEGEITVPSKTFLDLITNLPKDTISLESEKEQLKISAPNFSSSVLGMLSSDFPKVPTSIFKEKGLSFSSGDFTKALSQVFFASSNDETRPVLTGVLLIFDKNNLSLVATDGFRLSKKNLKIEGTLSDRLVLPKQILSELLKSDENDISFSFDQKDKQAVFGMGDGVFSSRLLEGEYPDFEKILPKDVGMSVRVDKEELLRAVKLSSVFARDSGNVVKIKILKSSLKISAESGASGMGEISVDAKIDGEVGDSEIAFNFRFLEDFLKSLEGEEVLMEITSPSSACVFKDPKDPDYLHLIMPVKIQG